MFFLPLPIFLFEIFAFLEFVDYFGFFPVVGAYILPSLLGFLILSFQSRAALFNLQRRLLEGSSPSFQAINMGAKFLSGIMLIAPLLLTRILGVLLLLPGSRHLLVLGFQSWLHRKIKSGAAGFFANGRGFQFGGQPFGRGGFGSGHPGMGGPPGFGAGREAAREERDATVIDVTPIEIEHTDKKTPR